MCASLLVVLVWCSGAVGAAWSAEPILVEDFAPGSLDYGPEPPQDLAATHDGLVSFVAFSENSGHELWTTNGKQDATQLQFDLCPGSCSSTAIERLGEAALHIDGGVLSRTDADGTTTLLEQPAAVAFLGQFEGRVVFYVLNAQEAELWRTDGTPSGTRRLKRLGAISLPPDAIYLAGDRFFLFAGGDLWTSKGSSKSTKRLASFDDQMSPQARLAAVSSNRIFFVARSPDRGQELWVSDGTTKGTSAVTDFETPDPLFATQRLTPLSGGVFFLANDATHGFEIWRSDGSATGTKRWTSFGFADPFGADPTVLESGGRLVFVASDGIHPYEVWSSDGRPNGTEALREGCVGGCPEARPDLVARVRDVLIFGGRRGGEFGLWASDGMPKGTKLLTALSYFPDVISSSGGAAVIAASSRLWFSRGTPAQTFEMSAGSQFSEIPYQQREVIPFGKQWVVSDVVSGAGPGLWFVNPKKRTARFLAPTEIASGSSYPSALRLLPDGSVAVKACVSGQFGTLSLWRVASPQAPPIRTWFPASHSCGSSDIRESVVLGDRLLFRAGFQNYAQLWLSEEPDSEAFQFGPDDVSGLFEWEGLAWFNAPSTSGGNAMWSTDGTQSGTQERLAWPEGVFGLMSGLPLEGRFLAWVSTNRFPNLEIWSSDGTLSNTAPLPIPATFQTRILTTHVTTSLALLAVPRGDDLPNPNYDLWLTDGSGGGTRRLGTDTWRPLADLELVDGALYVLGKPGDRPAGLWRVDLDTGFTSLISPNAFLFDATVWTFGTLSSFGSHLVFAGQDLEAGIEPWCSDGTEAGTARAADIRPGPASSSPAEWAASGDTAWFAANDGETGVELWRTNCAPDGTSLVADLATGLFSSSPKRMLVAGDWLYFAANDGVVGEELWAVAVTE